MGDVSVVLLTYNREREALNTLARLHALPEAPPIYVVDNASQDGSVDAIRTRYPNVQLIRCARNLGAAGRNLGVQAAQTPYIAFCDDDSWWTPGALKRAADLMDAYPGLAALTGRVLVGTDAREDPTSRCMQASPLPNDIGFPGTLLLGFMAGACMMRRRAFLDAGGYHPRLFLGREERLLAIDFMAAGWHMAYAPSVCIHHHPSALRDVSRRRRMLLRNGLWCAWLRRPLAGAWTETLSLMKEAWRDPNAGLGAVEALSALPWVLRNRHVVPPHVERALRRISNVYG